MKYHLMPLAAALVAAALPAFATTAKIVVDQPPPMEQQGEPVAPVRDGYTWAPGYWNWTGSKYEWSKGHYVQTRKGYRYVAPRWAQEKERWALYPEEWVKDEDDKDKTALKDGVPPVRR
jgi:hypothetical protein